MTFENAINFINGANEQFNKYEFTLWATEIKENTQLIGFIGLNYPTFEASFTPCVEIGWRLASEVWNKGYATEGAKAVLSFGFEKLGIEEIAAFTVPANVRSIRVIEKLECNAL